MSALPAVLAAAAAAGAAYLAFGAPAVWSVPAPRPSATAAPAARGPATGEQAILVRLRPGLAVLVALGGWAVLGGATGMLAGAVAAVVAWIVLGRSEPPAARRRRERLRRDLPTAVDLLAAVLAAGGSFDRALDVVGRGIGGPVGEELLRIRHQLDLGVDPGTVWRAVADHPQLAPLGRAAQRANESGASIAAAVRRLGDELRARARAEVEARAKTVEVRAAAPLGACFLPAFVLLGVVPLVAGLFMSLQLF